MINRNLRSACSITIDEKSIGLLGSLLIKSQALFERKIKMFFGKNKHNKRATVNRRLKNRRGGVLFGLKLRS